MGTFGNPISYNNKGPIGSATNPTTAVGLERDRENQRAILELLGTQAWSTVSILDGAITPSSSEIIVSPEAPATTDTLTTINTSTDGTTRLHEGMILRVKAAADNAITVINSSGINGVKTAGGKNVVLGTSWYLELKLVGTSWEQQSVSAVTSSGASVDSLSSSVSNVITSAGIAPVVTDTTQLASAVTTLVARKSPEANIPSYTSSDLGVTGFVTDSAEGVGVLSKVITLVHPGWVEFKGSKPSGGSVTDISWIGAVCGSGTSSAKILTHCVYPGVSASVFFPASSESTVKLVYLNAVPEDAKFFAASGLSSAIPVTPPQSGDLPTAPGPIEGGTSAETQTLGISCGGAAEETRTVIFGGDAGFSVSAVGGGDSSNTSGDIIGGGGATNSGGDVIGGGGATDSGKTTPTDNTIVYFGGSASEETPVDYIVCGNAAPYSATTIVDCGGAA